VRASGTYVMMAARPLTQCLLCGEDWRLMRFHLECFQVWGDERSAGSDEIQT